MPGVKVSKTLPIEVAIRKLRRECERARLHQELRRRKDHVKPTTKRRMAKAAAIKRHQKRLLKEMITVDKNRIRKKRRTTRIVVETKQNNKEAA